MEVAGFSTSYNLDGLLPFEGIGSGYGGNRNDRKLFDFHVKVPPESWRAIPLEQQEQILNGLERIALHLYWLVSKEWGNKQRVRVTIIRSQDTPRPYSWLRWRPTAGVGSCRKVCRHTEILQLILKNLFS
jgi:hypothetical protein